MLVLLLSPKEGHSDDFSIDDQYIHGRRGAELQKPKRKSTFVRQPVWRLHRCIQDGYQNEGPIGIAADHRHMPW